MKTLRVTLADIIGPTGTPNSTATVHARYVDTSGRGRDVHLTDGTIVVPVRRVASPDGDPEVFDFDVYANDAAPVREVDYGHLVEVSWTVVAPTGAKSSGVKRVQITDSMASVVQLGLLATPTPVPPYTGGYVLPGELDALDDRVVVLEEAPGGGMGLIQPERNPQTLIPLVAPNTGPDSWFGEGYFVHTFAWTAPGDGTITLRTPYVVGVPAWAAYGDINTFLFDGDPMTSSYVVEIGSVSGSPGNRSDGVRIAVTSGVTYWVSVVYWDADATSAHAFNLAPVLDGLDEWEFLPQTPLMDDDGNLVFSPQMFVPVDGQDIKTGTINRLRLPGGTVSGAGILELATTAEAVTGLDGARAVTPAGVKAVANTLVPTSCTITAGTGLTGGGNLTADRTLTVAYGTSAGTATEGNDSRITGAAQKSADLSDLASTATARTNLGLTDSAVVGALPIPDPGSYYPTDTLTAALQLIGGRERYGTGSPEGVVTAPVGTYYTDTAITNGAMRWAKKTGTGNTGWQVVEGDTGRRNIVALFDGWAGNVYLRRVNDMVTLTGDITKVQDKPGNIAGAISAGFTATSQIRWFQYFFCNGDGMNICTISGTLLAVNKYSGPVWVAGQSTQCFFSSPAWSTSDAWPTTLPGVAG